MPALSTSFSLRIKGSRPLSPTHASHPQSSWLAPAVATVSGGFLGNCCHGDSASSYCANVSRLPHLVCDTDACKMVRLKTLHLSALPCEGGVWFAWPKLLRSLLPISVLPEAPWAVTADGKSWTPEDKETCTLWAAWGGPRSSDIWWQPISKATSPCTGNRATAPSTFLQETKPIYKLRGRSRRPQLHPASVNVTMHTDPQCGTLASHPPPFPLSAHPPTCR